VKKHTRRGGGWNERGYAKKGNVKTAASWSSIRTKAKLEVTSFYGGSVEKYVVAGRRGATMRKRGPNTASVPKGKKNGAHVVEGFIFEKVQKKKKPKKMRPGKKMITRIGR